MITIWFPTMSILFSAGVEQTKIVPAKVAVFE